MVEKKKMVKKNAVAQVRECALDIYTSNKAAKGGKYTTGIFLSLFGRPLSSVSNPHAFLFPLPFYLLRHLR